MKKTTNIRKCLIITSLIALLGCISGATYSWFSSQDNVDFTKAIDGSSNGAYYASGDGKTEDTAYEINRPIHLYNLAWLQYLETYNKDADGDGVFDNFYFKVTADLDMTGYVLPPIGTTDNPFVGHFDGENHTISNLTISNTFSDFGSQHPISVTESSFKSPEIIGFFGVIGLLPSAYKSYSYTNATASSVIGLYLDNITVKNNTTTGTLAGFLAGYVNTTITNCGVHYCDFEFKSGTTKISSLCDDVSKYSYIGSINSTDYKIDGDTSGDAGTDYGTSTNLKQLYEDLGSKDGEEIPKDTALPFRRNSNSLISGGSTVNVTLAISSSGYSSSGNVTYATTYKSRSNNIGYYVGSSLKLYKTSASKYDYTDTDLYATSDEVSYTFNQYYKTPSESVLNYLTKTQTDSNGNTYRNGDYLLRLSDAVDYTSTWYQNADNYLVVKDSVVGSWKGDLLVPKRCIWVAPVNQGTFKLLLVNSSPGSSYSIALFYLQRYRNNSVSYSGDFSKPFQRESMTSMNDQYLTVTKTFAYIEFNANNTDTEYLIVLKSGKGPYIAYMDIGANDGSSEPTDTRTALTVDFVWKGTIEGVVSLIKITDTAYGYVKSEVFLAVATSDTNTANSKFCYKRIKPTNEDESNAFTSFVYYYQADSNSLVIRNDGESAATGHAVKKDSENVIKNA